MVRAYSVRSAGCQIHQRLIGWLHAHWTVSAAPRLSVKSTHGSAGDAERHEDVIKSSVVAGVTAIKQTVAKYLDVEPPWIERMGKECKLTPAQLCRHYRSFTPSALGEIMALLNESIVRWFSTNLNKQGFGTMHRLVFSNCILSH